MYQSQHRCLNLVLRGSLTVLVLLLLGALALVIAEPLRRFRVARV
jgi:hypothetical protein